MGGWKQALAVIVALIIWTLAVSGCAVVYQIGVVDTPDDPGAELAAELSVMMTVAGWLVGAVLITVIAATYAWYRKQRP